MISGEIDPQVSHAYSLHALRFYENAFLVSVPFSTHQPTKRTFSNPKGTCAMDILRHFVYNNDPGDTSCLERISPPDFDGNSQISKQVSQFLFGTPDLWS